MMKHSIFYICWVFIFCIVLAANSNSYSQVTAPEKYFGFQPGTDSKLFTYEVLIDYLKKLDEASSRVKMIEIGQSPMGKKMYAVFLSSEKNIRDLDELKTINKELALNAGLSDEAITKLVDKGKVFILATLSMHSNEVGPALASPLVAYEVATTTNSDKLHWLDDVVYMIVPCHNPDGMDMIVDYFNKTWFPQVLVEKHQMWMDGPRYFVPPAYDPIAENVDEKIWNWTWIFGSNMAKDMARDGCAGVSQHYRFDDYWIGSTETAKWKNVISLLTECASVQYAKPIYIEQNELHTSEKGLGDIVNYRMEPTARIFSTGSPVFGTSIPLFDTDRRVIATYPEDNILASGYVENEKLLSGKPAMVWSGKGKGQFVFYGFLNYKN